jgi:hypothetical protein
MQQVIDAYKVILDFIPNGGEPRLGDHPQQHGRGHRDRRHDKGTARLKEETVSEAIAVI